MRTLSASCCPRKAAVVAYQRPLQKPKLSVVLLYPPDNALCGNIGKEIGSSAVYGEDVGVESGSCCTLAHVDLRVQLRGHVADLDQLGYFGGEKSYETEFLIPAG
jgi:hypothetical protein